MEEVFQSLDKEIVDFKDWSGLHCKAGCGKCCLKPDIEATILEFIPFAYQLYRNGKALQWLENSNLLNSTCAILDSTQTGIGHCSSYATRGLICRLFGFSSRLNKYGQKELVSCLVIKTEQASDFQHAFKQSTNGAQVPLMRDYYMKLHAIDWELTQKFYPINVATRKAVETVLNYFTYRENLDVTFS